MPHKTLFIGESESRIKASPGRTLWSLNGGVIRSLGFRRAHRPKVKVGLRKKIASNLDPERSSGPLLLSKIAGTEFRPLSRSESDPKGVQQSESLCSAFGNSSLANFRLANLNLNLNLNLNFRFAKV